MKAIIFSAGLGTRLRPLTNSKPKALIEIFNVPLLEIVIKRLIEAGVNEIIINTHHFPEQIVDFIKSKSNFGIRIEFSNEEKLLDTGGGLKKASYFFDDSEPFFVHNVDVISDINLKEMYNQHLENNCLATLAVNKRETSRHLIFDEENKLCGWKSEKENKTIISRKPKGNAIELAFCGIHVISPILFEKMIEEGVFSIIDTYLRLAGSGESIIAFRADSFYWKDVGTIEQFQKFQ
jgi:NDP-sugar pyrophosphorylase family protein